MRITWKITLLWCLVLAFSNSASGERTAMRTEMEEPTEVEESHSSLEQDESFEEEADTEHSQEYYIAAPVAEPKILSRNTEIVNLTGKPLRLAFYFYFRGRNTKDEKYKLIGLLKESRNPESGYATIAPSKEGENPPVFKISATETRFKQGMDHFTLHADHSKNTGMHLRYKLVGMTMWIVPHSEDRSKFIISKFYAKDANTYVYVLKPMTKK